MKGLHKKTNNKTRKTIIFFVLFLVFFILLNSTRKVYLKREAVSKALIKMNVDISELEARELFLKNSEERLLADEGLEIEIKKKFSMARVGESVAVIISEEKADVTSENDLSFWNKLKSFFGINYSE